jgi:hypothetical protein
LSSLLLPLIFPHLNNNKNLIFSWSTVSFNVCVFVYLTLAMWRDKVGVGAWYLHGVQNEGLLGRVLWEEGLHDGQQDLEHDLDDDQHDDDDLEFD